MPQLVVIAKQRYRTLNVAPSLASGMVLLIRNVYLVVVLVAAAVFFSFAYLFHTLYPPSSPSCIVHQIITLPTTTTVANETTTQQQPPPPTSLEHIVFGIAGSAKLWNHRKNYVKLWWSRHKDENIRGFVWLDKLSTNVLNENNDRDLPPVCISENTQRFPYAHRTGNRAAIRISRILTETVRMGLKDVRWVVMGDDDTWFVPDNLVRVLRKYDHEQYYYIGSVSESHIQNIAFSYDMAFGGGGFAISYPLAVLIAKVQDRCIERYPELYGSDDRMQACMAEVGVPLTKEPGFHQFDLFGSIFGILAAHPVAPLVTMHHLDIIHPIFPKMNRVQALQHLSAPLDIDSASLMQQSICYDKANNWTISVSWGYVVEVARGHIPPREMERPSRTFLNWYKSADAKGFTFNTRPMSHHYCQKPFVFYMSNVTMDDASELSVSEHVSSGAYPKCGWKMNSPGEIKKVLVYKSPNPRMWEKSPRRNCCKVMPSTDKAIVLIAVGTCSEDEIFGSQKLACKEINVGGYMGWRLRVLESLIIILAFTQTLYLQLIHASVFSSKYDPGYRDSDYVVGAGVGAGAGVVTLLSKVVLVQELECKTLVKCDSKNKQSEWFFTWKFIMHGHT
ncbi:hypothetical protein Syun_018886 [Stephania yunnanensis]|uniref:Uncharacterized protein n=1 Tax=Stephania yunnanensis TaxID=152371 RepID=A0AAP0NWS8_9MAGN